MVMMNFHMVFIITVSCLISPFLASLDAEYHHSAFVDPDEIFKLYWTVKDGDKTMNFAVEVKTTGWVGFGISQGLSGSMKGADIVIGWVDIKGKGHLSDRYATSNSMPLVDQHQDYELTGASQDNGTTILKFKRKLKTCDKNDKDIPFGTTKVIYAYGKTDDVKYHGYSTRGARSLNLMNYVKNIPQPTNAKYFDVQIQNVSVHKRKTTYYCEAFKLSNLVKLSGVRHITEIAPIVKKKDRGVVHHMVLYACQDNFDESHLNASGQCYHPNMPDSIRECVGIASVYAWAVGGVNFKFPDHTGWPIGAAYSMKYVVLETHFDNPSQKTDFLITSGLRFYYEMPRKYEASTLVTGASVAGSLLIPPKQENWMISGYCPKECSSKIAGPGALNQNEIKMFASFPHAHKVGTGIWTKHLRDGKEIEEIIRDANYDFDYQQTHLLRKELSFKAGDELITYCRYNSMKRSFATIGGLSTADEMCLNFIMYYPQTNFTKCISLEVQLYDNFTKHYARPVRDFNGNKYNESASPSLQEYKNWTDIKWNKTMLQQLQSVYDTNGPNALYPMCAGTLGVHHQMHLTKKPVIRQKLPLPADVCANIKGVAAKHSSNLLQTMATLLLSFVSAYVALS